MTRPADKQKELAQARELLLQLRLGEICDADRERPDFGVALPAGRTAGLEVVRAMDEGIAAGRGAIKKLNKRVLAGLVANKINAQVVYSMSEGCAGLLAPRTMRLRLEAEADALVKLARLALGEPGRDGEWRRYQHFDDIMNDDGEVCWRDPDRDRGSLDLAGLGIEYATAVMVRACEEPHAGSTGSGRGQPRNIIQDAIDEKAKLLGEYRQAGYDEQWLLVVGSDGTGGSLDISDAEGEFVSRFDRTFFLESFEVKCVELRMQLDQPRRT